MSEEEEQERPAKETTEPMAEKKVTVTKSNTETKLNTVGSGLEKQPRLLTGNRLFGRLAGKTLESLASRQKTDSELKREEVGT